MAKCRSCGAEILWISTVSGKKMPVDAERVHFLPDSKGKGLFVTDTGEVMRGVRLPNDYEHYHVGYVSHFATCPYGESHRKGRGEQ